MPATTHPMTRKAGRPRIAVPRARLVEIARRIFADNGYHNTTLDQVAEQAGIRRASLLHRFGSKANLYRELLDQVVGDLRNLVRSAFGPQADFLEALDVLGGRVVDYLGGRPGVGRMLLRELVDGGPYLEGAGIQAVQDTLEVTTAFLASGMSDGAFREQDPRQLALTIVGIHLYYFATLPSTGAFIGAEAYTAEGVAVRKAAVLAHVRSVCEARPGEERRTGAVIGRH